VTGDHDVFLVPAQFATIQEAIDAVCRPSTIVLGAGVYAEDLAIAGKASVVIESARFGRRGVTIIGAGAESVVRVEGSSLYLSGIEIRSDGRARGIEVRDGSVSLQECVIAGNGVGERHAEVAGAGMLCLRSSVRVQKSTIAGNTIHGGDRRAVGGGLHLVDCSVEIAGSSIQTNAVYSSVAAAGGGILCERARMRMWRSRVTDNVLFAADCDGAGIYLSSPDTVRLGGSVISGNGAAQGDGGGIFIAGDAGNVRIHRDTVVRQNHPDDVSPPGRTRRT
jgi:hypothetical protein